MLYCYLLSFVCMSWSVTLAYVLWLNGASYRTIVTIGRVTWPMTLRGSEISNSWHQYIY